LLAYDQPPTELDEGEDEDDIEIKEVGWRWLMLLLFFAVIFNNFMTIVSFATISVQVAEAFDVSVMAVNMCALASPMLYIPMNILAQKAYGKFTKEKVLRFAVAI